AVARGAAARVRDSEGSALARAAHRRKIALPVVLISGHADVPMAVAAIKAGAEDFIEKPADDTKLVAAINRALTSASERQDVQKSHETLGCRFARLTPRQGEIFHTLLPRFPSPPRA